MATNKKQNKSRNLHLQNSGHKSSPVDGKSICEKLVKEKETEKETQILNAITNFNKIGIETAKQLNTAYTITKGLHIIKVENGIETVLGHIPTKDIKVSQKQFRIKL